MMQGARIMTFVIKLVKVNINNNRGRVVVITGNIHAKEL